MEKSGNGTAIPHQFILGFTGCCLKNLTFNLAQGKCKFSY